MSAAAYRIVERGIERLKRGEVLTPEERRQLEEALDVLTVGK